MRYRKKTITVEAIQFLGKENDKEVADFMQSADYEKTTTSVTDASERLSISTNIGSMTAIKGDWIIKGEDGKFYPINDSIFKQIYEPDV